MSLRRLLFVAAVVIAIGVIHRRRREKSRELSTGSKPIEAVDTQTVG
jgi:hypothetical protein